jgi:hypothetical protein
MPMPHQIEADGHTWRVTNFEQDRRREVRTIVFHCLSNSQRPYRVVEVPDDIMGDREIGGLSADELTRMFEQSQPMDYSHDAAMRPASRGHGHASAP